MIYLIVGIKTDVVSVITTTMQFIQATQYFNNQYIGYEKVQMYLINIHTKSITLIGER